MAVKIQLRRGTAAQWTTSNPVLSIGEIGIETDTYKIKVGNGLTAWNDLTYLISGSSDPGDGTGGGGAVTSVSGKIGNVVLTKSDVGLGNVDNTSDANKPLSGPQATAIAALARVTSVNGQTGDIDGLATIQTVNAHVANTSNPHLTTKAQVGLSNVDNTSDTSKPVSTAVSIALAGKAPLASPAFTGTPTGINKSHVGLGNVDNTSDASKPLSNAQVTALAGKIGSSNSTVTNIIKVTSSEYAAISTKNPTTLYMIVD